MRPLSYEGRHLGHLLIDALRTHADKVVLEIGGQNLTGREMEWEVSKYASALDSWHVRTGSPVAILAPNRPEVLFVIGAGQMEGSRRTALHPLGSLDDHVFVMKDAGIETLIVDPMFQERAADLLERVASLRTVLTLGSCDVGTNLIAWADTAQGSGHLKAAELDADAIVSITYTGGTTGRPKGVVGTASSMAAMTQVQLAEWEWPEAPRFLMCTPLSHAGAAFFVPTLVAGGSMVVLPRFDPESFARTVQEQRITATMLVPSMIYALLDHPAVAAYDLSSLQTVYYGAAPINPVRLAEAIARFGPVFAQFYGQSECPMVISYLAKADHAGERLASCGRPSVHLDLELRDEDGKVVAPGEPGEICVSGPVLARDYWHRPDETADAFVDGWLRTGDVARQDEDGFLYIVDRTKDMIVTGGFNVFPREVEDVVATHPRVAQVAVVGTPDEKWGEAVTAVVVLRDGEYDDDLAAELTALVRERKGPVHVPKQVIPVESIPLTGLGKPDKVALRRSLQAD